MNSRYCCVVDLIRVIDLGSPGINVFVCMIGEDSPGVGLRMVVGRAFRSLCCKAMGRRTEGLLTRCPEPVPCQSCRWVAVKENKFTCDNIKKKRSMRRFLLILIISM
jgi:hypothetical protein